MAQSHVLDEIRTLDPHHDHQRIVFLSTRYDFPFDTTRALEFALFRTFAVPSVAALLDRTGEFHARAQRRYDDTDIIVSELMEWGYDSDRGKRALRRMNQLHGRFPDIRNDDFLYVLSTFVYEPIRWNARFGWRPLCEQERLAYFYFWREVGKRMGIKGIPTDYETFERFNRDYERRHFRFTEASRRVGTATRELFAGWFPAPLSPLVRDAIHAMLDDPLRDAFGFPRPSPLMRRLVPAALRARAGLLRYLPARRSPSHRTAMRHRSHPDGYTIERLGPPDAEKTVPEARPAMASHAYHFITHWRVEHATPEEVFAIIDDAPGLKQWWPAVYLDVVEREPGDANGIGKVIDLHTKGWLPYTLRWQFHVTEKVLGERIALEANGDFVGRGVWTFARRGSGVDVTYDWHIRAEKPLLRRLSFLLKPVFAANHRWAMDRGLESLELEVIRRRATTPEQRDLVPAPPPPTTSSPVPLMVGIGAGVFVCGVIAYRLARRRREPQRALRTRRKVY